MPNTKLEKSKSEASLVELSKTNPQKMRVLSFDMDGCILNGRYLDSRVRNLISHNRKLLDLIKKENKDYVKVRSFIGSNRQSFAVDLYNALMVSPISQLPKGSAFPALEKISNYLDVEIDPMLLADIFGKLPLGTSFDRAMQALKGTYRGNHADWVFDESKVLILYAQMHKAAIDNPDKVIDFDFYDDRKDILDSLAGFFRQHPELIPKNITLRLHQYSVEKYISYGNVRPIEGTGENDLNFQQSIIRLAERAKQELSILDQNHPARKNPLHVAFLLLHREKRFAEMNSKMQNAAKLIDKFNDLTDKEYEDYGNLASQSYEFFTLLETIDSKIKILIDGLVTDRVKENKAYIHGHVYKREVLAALYTYYQSEKSTEDAELFKDALKASERKYNNRVLGHDRTVLTQAGRYFKKTLANVCSHLLMVVGVGVYMHMKHYESTGNWLFFSKTRSSEALSKISDQLAEEVGCKPAVAA